MLCVWVLSCWLAWFVFLVLLLQIRAVLWCAENAGPMCVSYSHWAQCITSKRNDSIKHTATTTIDESKQQNGNTKRGEWKAEEKKTVESGKKMWEIRSVFFACVSFSPHCYGCYTLVILSQAADVSHFSPRIIIDATIAFRYIFSRSLHASLPPFLQHIAIFCYSLHASICVLNQE